MCADIEFGSLRERGPEEIPFPRVNPEQRMEIDARIDEL
jgi:hypothetical protein